MADQTPITFRNRDGLQLFGVLHRPTGPSVRNLAVILLSPGVKMRVGPQRLYLELTRTLVDLGLPVFRFDFAGLGDSEGTLTEDLLKDVYNHIEVGRFVNDSIDAVDWVETHLGITRVIVSGLCGGAITGLLAASRDPRMVGLLALGITPVLASRCAKPALYMTVGELELMRRGYLEKVSNPKAWLRFLTLQSDYRVIWRALLRPWQKKGAAPAVQPPPEDDNANPLFPPAFFKMLATMRPMLLVFGGTDRLRWEFEEKFEARHREGLAAHRTAYQTHVIADANHTLSFRVWQQELFDVAVDWLRRNFAEDLASVQSSGPVGAVRSQAAS
jgi:pimeloyl-ACP methyl ester carboxylesterase